MRLSSRTTAVLVLATLASAVSATFCAAEAPTITAFLTQALLTVAWISAAAGAMWTARVRCGASRTTDTFLLVYASMTVLAPLAMEACDRANRANAAFGFAAIVIALLLAHSAHEHRHIHIYSTIIIAATIGSAAGAQWGSWTHNACLPSLHRDLVVLLPVILLGMTGCAERSASVAYRQKIDRTWALGSGAGIVLLLAGCPLDPRILCLPFWWLAPAGAERWRRLLHNESSDYRASRAIGILAGLATLLLAVPAAMRWRDAVFLLGYVISSR